MKRAPKNRPVFSLFKLPQTFFPPAFFSRAQKNESEGGKTEHGKGGTNNQFKQASPQSTTHLEALNILINAASIFHPPPKFSPTPTKKTWLYSPAKQGFSLFLSLFLLVTVLVLFPRPLSSSSFLVLLRLPADKYERALEWMALPRPATARETSRLSFLPLFCLPLIFRAREGKSAQWTCTSGRLSQSRKRKLESTIPRPNLARPVCNT